MKIHIITAALPPLLDGIGDYTANLAAELACSTTVTVLTGAPAAAPIPGVQVVTAFSADDPRSVWNLVDRIAADPPDWVLLQYNPFSYGRWGLNLHLPRVMRQIKRDLPGTRFALMVHEPFVPINNWKNAAMTTWQRWQLWSLGRTADVVFFSIEPWARKFTPWFPARPVLHLPVGSNIPLVPIARAEARARLGIPNETVVFGLFGTAHDSRLLGPVSGAMDLARKAGRDALVLYIGPHGQVVRKALGVDMPFRDDGRLSPDEVSLRFAALDLYFAAYADGISTRRTTLMTGLQHGAAIIGTRGHLTDSMLKQEDGRAFLLADSDAPDESNRHALCLMENVSLREQLGREAQRLYQAEFAWERIAARLLDAMKEYSSKLSANPSNNARND